MQTRERIWENLKVYENEFDRICISNQNLSSVCIKLYKHGPWLLLARLKHYDKGTYYGYINLRHRHVLRQYTNLRQRNVLQRYTNLRQRHVLRQYTNLRTRKRLAAVLFLPGTLLNVHKSLTGPLIWCKSDASFVHDFSYHLDNSCTR